MPTQEEWAARYRAKFAQYEVPREDREQLIAEGEVGTYPGDETLMPRIERSGRKEFEQIKGQRLDLTGQVKQARQREKELHPYPKIERFADTVLGYVPGILSPDVPTPEPTAKPSRSNPEKLPKSGISAIKPNLTPSPRFTVEEGEIIDNQNRQIIAPHEFNRLSNPQEKEDVGNQLRDGGYLMDEPPVPKTPKQPAVPTSLADAPVDLEIPEVHVVGERPQARSVSEGLTMAVNNFFQGVAAVPADALKAVAIASKDLDAMMPDLLKNDKAVEDRFTYKLGKAIEQTAKRIFPSDPQSQQEFMIGVLPQAMGSMTGFLAGGLAGAVAKAPATTAAVLGAGVGGSQQYEDASNFKADEDTRRKAFWLGSAVGTTEALPIAGILSRYNKATGGAFYRILKETGVTAAQEFIQEWAQQVGSNAIAKQLYDEHRGFFDNAGISGEAGGATGAIVGFLSGAIQGRKIRKQQQMKEGGASESPFAGEPTPPPQPQPMPATPDIVATIPDSLNIRQQAPFLVKKFPSPSRPAPEVVGMPQAPVEPPAPAPAPLPQLPVPAMEQPPIVPAAQAAASPEPLPGAVLSEPQITVETANAPSLMEDMSNGYQQPSYGSEADAGATWEAGPPGVSDMADNEAAMSQPEEQAVSSLRSERDNRVSGMEEELPGIPGLPGAETVEESPARPNRQQQGVRAGERQVGDTGSASEEPAKQQAVFIPGEEPFDRGVGRGNRNPVGRSQVEDPGVPMDSRAGVDHPSRVSSENEQDAEVQRGSQANGAVGQGSRSGLQEAQEQNSAQLASGEGAKRADGAMSFDEFLKKTRFYKSGKSKRAEVPGGERVNLKDDRTENNFRELSREFLRIPYENYLAKFGKDKAKVTKAKDEKPIAAVPFVPAAQKQDERGNPEFDYSDLPKRPTVKMIIGDWRKAGRPKSFTTTYGEGFARFNFEELHGIPQWWDEGNGAGIDRNRVLDALKAEKFEGPETATPPTPELASTALPTQGPKKAQDTPTPERVSTESPSRRQETTPEQATKPNTELPQADNSKEPKAEQPPTPDKIEYVVQPLRPGAAPETLTPPKAPAKPKESQGGSTSSVLEAIDKSPEVNRNGLPKSGGGMMRNPIKRTIGDQETNMEDALDDRFKAQSFIPKSRWFEHVGKEEVVPVANLVSPQNVIEKGIMRAAVKNALTDDKLPLVIRHEGEMIVRDGNHRIVAEILKGKDSIKARVIDLDAMQQAPPAPPTPEAVAPKEKPATIPPPTPEEVSNEQPKRVGPEDTASPGATPAEVVPITAGKRKAEAVRPPATERSGGGARQPGGERTQAGRSDGENPKPDLPAERGGSTEPERNDAAVSGPAGTDYQIPEDLDIPKGQKAKFKANVSAIELLKRLETEGRLATPDEQGILAKYTGWGGLPQAFQWSYEWQKELSQLRELLTEEEYNSARASTPNAHYTDPATIKAIYTGLEHLGFKGGRLLEPGAGVGHFLGAMPESMAGKSQRTAVELDSLSARIAKQLYQRANVINNEYQKVALPQDFFDVAVGNVPFANVKVFDPNNKDLNKLNFSLHDYYFAKAISQVRPGGIVAFITSRYTMDKVNGKLRDYLSKHADLLGAIRLPNTQFKDIANTDVTTDIIVLQKRDPGTPYAGHAWGTLQDVQTEQGPASVNEYFAAHPEQIMGKLSLAGSMYRDKEITVETDSRDMPQALREAFARLPEKVLRPRAKPASATPRGMLEALQATDDVKNGAFTIQNNALYVRDREQFVPVEDATPTDLERAKGLIGLREQVREVFRTQLASADEKDIAQARKELNARYDKFVKKWGPINGRANKSLFRADPDYATLQALEKDYDKKANTAKKADIFSKRVIEYRSRVATAGSPKEALLVSLNESGAIDWDRMAELTGQTTKEIQEGLRGVVYHDPSGTWDTADGYLSGNVRQKLKAAEEAAKIDPRFQENVEALKQVIPEDLKPEQIHMKLGHGWIPTDVYHDFIAHLLGISNYNKNLAVKYNAQVGAYSVTLPKQLDKTRNETTYGTPRYEAKDLIQDGLHSQLPTVYDRTFDDKRVVNEKETLAAREKLEAIQDEFRKWVWQDPERTKTLSRLYNDEFNSVVERKLDGAHLTLPGANPLITLRPHQKNVIWRALQSGNTLLAHVVGAGKTFAMVGIALESRRLRLANKPMIAVPNHLVEQWRDSVLALYPAAKVLMATKEDFEAANRKQLVARVATGDWDLVVISHSQLSRIPISLDSFEKFVAEQTEILEEYIREMKAESGKQSRNITKELEKAKKRLEAKLERRKAEVGERADNALNFEETGVDMLLVDEADLFKNLYFPTRMTRVAGLPNTESQRSYDLFLKTQYLNKLTKNKGVIFATGTPVSNSMAEVFTMQRYLQPQELEKAGLTHFDAWARQFGNTITSMELAPDGSGYRPRTRFAEFVNVPELTQMFRQVMDVQSQEDLKLPVPKLRTGKPINMVAKPSEDLKAYTKDLIKRAENLKKMKVDPRKDNMLKITGDGRNAALDIRLRVPGAPEDKNGKVAMLINQVVEEHEKSKDVKGTQLVFLDLSTPKGEAKQKDGEPVQSEEAELGDEAALRGSVYQDIKRKLLKRGIPEKEVAFIHDADTDEKKSKLFADVNAGRVRVLIGSTEKMGAGTNVQERMVAIHNLDAPWRPRDLEQRNGRGIRQGNKLYNENPETFEFAVFNYATEAPSFDVYMWQTLEAKARTIAQVMRGDPTIRTIHDVDTAVMSIAEMKAIASGNPLIKERMTADIELHKLNLLKSQHRDNKERIRYELANLPSAEKTEQVKLEALRRDKAVRDASNPEPLAITIDSVTYDEAEDAGKAILQFVTEANAIKRTETAKYPLGTYRGFNLGLSVFLDKDARLELSRPSSLLPIKTTLFTSDASPAGLVDRLNNALNKVDTLIEEAELGLQKAKKREDELKAELEKPFEKEDRLKQLESRIADIDKQLDLTNKDEGVIGGGTEQAEPTPVEEPKPGIMGKLMEERGSFQPVPGGKPKYAGEAQAYKQQRAKEDLIGFSSADSEIEARVREAKKGLQPATIGQRIKDHVGEVWKLVSREFEHLPDTAQFSVLRNDLLRLQKYKGIAADKIQRDLADIIKPLSRKQYDQFEWKALLSDLSREAEQGHALPFGYTPEKVQDDLDRINEVVERDPKVKEAWAKRQQLWDRIKGDYQGSMDAIGFDVSKKLTKQDYFRHQVLEHAKERAVSGTGSKIRTPTGRGFLKSRKGSSYDINANYVQAEFEVMAQMVYDTQLAKVIKNVDRHYNIRKELEAQAKAENKSSLADLIAQDEETGAMIETQLQEFKKRMGMHMAMLKKALELENDDEVSMKQVAEIADDLESPGNPSARGFLKAVNERKAYIQDLLGPKYMTWDRLIPETHQLWQPREGNVFYMADSIPANLAKALQEGMLAEAGFPIEKLRKVLAQGGAREEYVIPNEAAETLDNLSKPKPNWFVEANRQLLGHWKQLMLIAPRRILRYNLRNLTGDADALFVGNPSAFKKLPQAAKDLLPVIFKDEQLTGEAKAWMERGGYGTTLQFQELGDLNELKAFRHTLDRASKGGLLSIPATVWNGYWKAARLSTDYREAMMRYAAYLDYLEQMQKNNGRPKNFGASRPETVMALPDIRDRAFKLSNELLGAYDRVSHAGKTIRNFWIPFYSWMEVNATRYFRLVNNALDGGNGGQLRRGALVTTRQAAGFLIRLSAMWSLLQAWNYMMFGDDEDELRDANPTVANRPHILFGRDDNGKIQYLSGIGALGDLLSWFGLDAFPGLVGDIMHDRLTIGEALQTAAKAPVNKIWQGITPTVKMPIELTLRESTYPDIFNPRPIQNRGDYLGNQTTFGPEIQKMEGKPGKPLYGGEDLTGLLVQRSDPKSAAYGTWNGIEKKYLERMGKDSSAVFWRSPRGEALSNWGRAISEKDTASVQTWKSEYEKLEREKYGNRFTTMKMYADIEKSLRTKAPLAGVSKSERDAIVKELDAKEKRTLKLAEQYYRDTIMQVLPPSRRYAFESKMEDRGWLTPDYGTPDSLTY